ncbi:MAG: EutN/CcmL family microcompartment protein [Planctomycetes bacterium]|nr:EutN/CcmL family microcompartment protein [Planctomycetota bacterium]
MQLARVIGTATATIKHETLIGAKLLLVMPMLADGRSPDGDPLLAVDGVGAGWGETVMITSDGRGARELLKAEATPVRWTIIGIKD